MAVTKDDAHYAEVSAGQEISSEQVPASGKEWIIGIFQADAPSSSDGWVALVWDYEGASEEFLTLTYTSTERVISRSVVGDGVKKLAIVLHNGDSDSLVMGGLYKVKEL